MVNIREMHPAEFTTMKFKYSKFEESFFKSKKEGIEYIKKKKIKSKKNENKDIFLAKVKNAKIKDRLRELRYITKNGIFYQSTGQLIFKNGKPIINELIFYLTLNIDYEIKGMIKELEDLQGVYIKLKLINIAGGNSYSYTTTGIISNAEIQNNLIAKNYLRPDSVQTVYCSGFYIFIPDDVNKGLNINEYYQKFKAFSPSENIKFHKMSTCSTTISRLCIYQTYFYLYINSSKKIKQNEKLINESLEKESKEIKKYIKNGELINFLTAKLNDTNKYFIVEFFRKSPTIAIKISKDGIEEIKDITKLKNEKVFLYDNKHVAPRINDNIITTSKEKKSYCLRPTILKSFEEDEEDDKDYEYGFNKDGYNSDKTLRILGYDIETYTDEKTQAISYCICLSNGKYFYGEDCIYKFCEYLNSIKTIKNFSKTKPKKKVQKIYIYGFNNSRFDNLLIFNTLLDNNDGSKLEYTIAGSAIKRIKYANIEIFDLSLYYAGTLSDVVTSFKLKQKKGVFPYKFVNKNNLDYVGVIPSLEYWNSEDDLNYYKKQYKTFDLKNYTIEYCLLDCKLVYELAIRHLKTCRGTITRLIYSDDCNCKVCKVNNNYCQTTGQTIKKCSCDKCKLKDDCIKFKKLKQIDNDDLNYLKTEYPDNVDEYTEKIKSGLLKLDRRHYDTTSTGTGAGIAIKMFSQVFQDEPIYNSPVDIQTIERQAYKGGRTEVFKKSFKAKKCTKINYKDINSSYPYAMTKKMPFRFKKKYTLSETVRESFIDYNLYHARTEYKGDDPFFIPNLLNRSDKGDIIATKNTPYGYHWGVELNEAIKNNCCVYIDEVLEYEGKAIFKEYAEYFYNKRIKIKNVDPVLANFFKLLLNSLYGKFAQKPHGHKIICKDKEDILHLVKNKNIKITNFDELGDKIIIEYSDIDDDFESIGNLIRFSSYISACARSNLSIGMRDVGHKNIYYCDTDSIFHTGTMSEHLISNNRLGAWKDEEPDGIETAYFFAPKTYFYISGKTKIMKAKGIPKKYLTEEKINELIDKNIMSIDIEAMFFRSLEGVKIDKQTRNIRPVLNKRVWDGNDSKPYNNYEDWYNDKYNNKVKKSSSKSKKCYA